MAAFLAGRPTIIRPSSKHTATIIFLHGLGDSGQNLSSISQSFRLPHVKWVFPTAPNRPITLNGGASMPGWFDLYRVDRLLQGDVDHEGVRAAVGYLDGLVEAESKEVPASRIVVGGFSQGGHVAIKHALSTRHALPACVVLSSWTEAIPGEVAEYAKARSYFVGHGTADPLIPSALATATVALLKNKGCKIVSHKMYQGMAHSTSRQELDDVKDFLQSVIPETEEPPVTAEQIDGMSIRELRGYLSSKGVSTTGFLEKAEFISAAKSTLR